ncbi:MAG: hypothetical protein LWX83_05225 [Anaerolineae bacterium]|nr:hypothetical protein [Anaerolineae bacterium]
MNDLQFKKLIDLLSEDLVPHEVNLWPSIRQHFKQNNKPFTKGDLLMKNLTNGSKNRRLTVTLLAACLLFVFIWLLTPQGQVWAQQILLFFNRSNNDVLPLQSWQMTPAVNAESPTADPANILDAHAGIADVERQAEFKVLQPAWIPQILTFSGASYDPAEKITRLFYQLDESNGLALRQEPSQLSEKCELCGEVGASAAIVNVYINDQPGEYVEGTWNLTDNGPVWEATPYLKTLRWKSGEMAFELLFMGPPDALSQEDLVKIAESLK